MFDLNLGHPFASIYQNGKVDLEHDASAGYGMSKELRTNLAGTLNFK